MTATELVERMDTNPDELLLWVMEDVLRDEDRRDAQLLARAKQAVKRG